MPGSDDEPSIPSAGRRGRRSSDRSPVIRSLERVIGALLLLGVLGFLVVGANRPGDPKLVPAADPSAARGAVGMGSGTLSVVGSKAVPACVLQAVTAAQQEHGLMGRTSLAPYAGMAFVFARPTTERFWMKDTLIPLSIAWFDTGGVFLASATMPPCPKSTASCPTYGPGKPYALAVEVPSGRFKPLGIGPGATVQLGGPCS